MRTPPFLLATALLFWGWQTGQIIFAIPLALILEGPRILPTRFELSALEFNRVWNLCLLAFVTLIVTIYVSNKGLGAIYVILQWIPLTLCPMVTAQLYSTEGRIPAVGFKIFYRQKDNADNHSPVKTIDIFYPYLAICILAACAVGAKNMWFYWGMCLLTAWALWSVRPRRFSWVIWSASLSIIVLLGFWGGQGLFALRNYVDAQVIDWLSKRFRSDQDPFWARTAIGEIVELKMDDSILFYVDYKKGHLKKTLLPQSAYNVYKDAAWYAAQSKFINLTSSSENQWTFANHLEPEEIIQVSMDLDQGKGLLPTPNQAFQFENLPVLYLRYNPLGAVQVKKGPEFIEYQVGVHSSISRNVAPRDRDLSVPVELRPVFRKIVRQLKLVGKPPDEILKIVDQYFEDNFSYTLNLTREDDTVPPLVEFLDADEKRPLRIFCDSGGFAVAAGGDPRTLYLWLFCARVQLDGGEHGGAVARCTLLGHRLCQRPMVELRHHALDLDRSAGGRSFVA